ncbi:unnamed protein product, partial [Coccothraustes coccothraustes]
HSQHSQIPPDPSAFLFDARSGAVRAQGGASENMREKVQAVRAVVPNRSNTEIVLVLQHFDNAVDRAVQAFMEGNASEVLKEWTVTGKKKGRKKKPRPAAAPGPGPEEKPQKSWEKLGKLGMALNGFHGNRGPSLESLPEAGAGNGIPAAPAPAPSGPGSPGGGNWVRNGKKMGKNGKNGNCGEKNGNCGVKNGPSLERSLKDLQRCSVALARFRALLRDEVENSLRRVKGAFSEIQGCLMDREVALLAEMDKVKAEAMDLLALRQRRAEALRALTEAAPGMSEEQLQELRADIKHFVSERKFDEELGRAGRFGCDLEALRGSIGAFGQVSHPRPSYSSRSRCSSGPASSAPAPASAPGSAPAFPPGSAPGSAPGSPPGAPEFPPGSGPGSGPAFPAGSGPGSPRGRRGPSGASPGPTGAAAARRRRQRDQDLGSGSGIGIRIGIGIWD